jgi:hypothetical protein
MKSIFTGRMMSVVHPTIDLRKENCAAGRWFGEVVGIALWKLRNVREHP